MMLINTILGSFPEIKGVMIKKQLDSAKVSMDNVFYVLFTKPPDTNTSKENKDKDDKT